MLKPMPLTKRDLQLIRRDRQQDLKSFMTREELHEEFATKKDLLATKNELKTEISDLRMQMFENFVTKNEFSELREDVKEIKQKMNLLYELQDMMVSMHTYMQRRDAFNESRFGKLEIRVDRLEGQRF